MTLGGRVDAEDIGGNLTWTNKGQTGFATGADGKPMQIRHPRSFADVEEIIDRLKDNLTVIVYLNELSASTAERVTDILSGAIYALGGGMAQLQKDMFIFTPDGVDTQ